MKRSGLFMLSMCLLLACSAWFSSCVGGRPLVKEAPANNSSYRVEYLFEYDGCKVYRFMDMEHYIYFTNCQGDVTSIENDSIRTVNKIRKQPVIIQKQTLD